MRTMILSFRLWKLILLIQLQFLLIRLGNAGLNFNHVNVWSNVHAIIQLLGYKGFDPRFRVGLESGWNCVNAFSYASTSSSKKATRREPLGKPNHKALPLR